MPTRAALEAMEPFHPAVRDWFFASFPEPTTPQSQGWPAIARGDSTLIVAPTGSGKTLAAFLWCINRLMFEALPPARERCRVLYVSPLKALAVDIERNLRAPIVGVANMASFRSAPYHLPAVAVRTGDTPANERARFKREPADILITTPESLYLLLTSTARETLRSVDTVIVDEIHALVPTKRGAHLMLSLERLEHLVGQPLQRIGLSATQRPLDVVARFLGGARRAGSAPPVAASVRDLEVSEIAGEFETGDEDAAVHRDVTIVDAHETKALRLTVEVPVEDMARMGEPIDIPSGPAAQGPVRTSIWSAIHPRLLELIHAHRSTLIFVNSRRVAERLAGALNELAGETLVLAHHGSIARPQRMEIEDRLKAGAVRALVATSSLELGIDMGAIDLVIQIEAPPSVASGLQRIGRGGHHVNAVSEGIIFPKYRGDLVACAAVTRQMHLGRVEATRYPHNPLDVLAQHIVAMASLDAWDVDELFAVIRRAAPFTELSRSVFEGVLDMLAGRYPSDEFAELRPRVTWDRVANTLVAREGARRVAVVNGGTIPDRGLYGVFLAGAKTGTSRVGELDEEMVFESRVGETFVLGASTWRIEEITHDRVLVSPAPGQPGKTPFWHGDGAGRPLELGREIGRLVRTLRHTSPDVARATLVAEHGLDTRAAENLLAYLGDQATAATVPDDHTIVIERTRDELGDWRVCVLSPLGGRIHAPWSMAVAARVRDERGVDVETMWADDGFVVRFPETDAPPDVELLLPPADEVEDLVLGQLGATALFAAKFREVAARALLLPRRRPGGRAPLWQQRKRAADLLAVAARFGSFPMLLETYRECLRDVFDMPALVGTLREVESRQLRVVTVDGTSPSPFAASLLFGYVANYIYEGDAPIAERRAQALAIDQSQLRELLGEAELRELLEADALHEVERQLQHLDERYRAKSRDGLHDLLLAIGDLSADEAAARCVGADTVEWLAALSRERRAVPLPVAGETRYVAVEDASRYRDALGVPMPPGLPQTFLAPVADPRGDLVHRYARTHGPFTTAEVARRYGMAPAAVEGLLKRLVATGRLVEGEFRPGGKGHEWCDAGVLRALRRRSLARVRHEVEPVEPAALGRLITTWQGVTRRRSGLDALLDVVENLQGAALPASILEREILPARLDGYNPADLDALAAAGEVVWCGVESLGERDGRVALYLTDHLQRLWRPPTDPGALGRVEARIVEHLRTHGASFFAPLHAGIGGGFEGDTVQALWNLVWKGLVTNDTFHALRAFTARVERHDRRARRARRAFRSRRAVPPAGEGRWSLTTARMAGVASATEWSAAVAQQLLARYGIVTRESVAAEWIPGGFTAIYEVLKALEDAGRIRRGYFATGVGAAQFALPAALEQLRALRDDPEHPEVVHLAATDPANPYGAILKWPGLDVGAGRGPSRSVGATVILVNGACAAYVARGGRLLSVYLPDDEPQRSTFGRAIADELAALALSGLHRGLLVGEINGVPAGAHPLAPYLVESGFAASALGFAVTRRTVAPA
ncbi:MAG TPA: DEAD/DEAH box helicase [Methylomirabilota bacterium]